MAVFRRAVFRPGVFRAIAAEVAESDPIHLVPTTDGPSPLDDEGLSPFGGLAFGEGAFGATDQGQEADQTAGQTILQRHKVDKLLSGYGISRKRYQDFQDKWAAERKARADQLAKIKRQEDARKLREFADRRAAVDFRIAGRNAVATDASLQSIFLERMAALDRQAMLAQIERQAMAAVQAGQMQAMMNELAMQHRMRAEQEEEAEALELLMAA
jgi:hypothetical protein